VPTDLPQEKRVSQLAKNTAKQSVAVTNRSEEGLDIPKSRKKLVSYRDLVSWIVQCTRYKVQSNELEIQWK
jgi:adenosyl cobinamide kinase/adenosyl cobinamide phosphate guanylyltransferase